MSAGGTVSLHDLWSAWSSFFFQPEPATSLAVFRIVFGLLMLVNSAVLAKDLWRFNSPEGMVPAAVVWRDYSRHRLSLFNLLPDSRVSVLAVFGLLVLSCLALTVGFWTRTCAALVFLTLVSFHHRNPWLLHSGDTISRLVLFLLIFSSAGKALSLDAMSTGAHGTALLAGPSVSPWCTRLIQIQIAILYLRTVWWKLKGRSWRNGTAAYFPLQLPLYRRWILPRWCLRRLPIAVATYATLLIEIGLGTTIWVREWRYPTLIAGCLLHLGLEVALNVQLFGWIVMSTYLVFIDPHDMIRWLGHLL